jgi:hypothetical protein
MCWRLPRALPGGSGKLTVRRPGSPKSLILRPGTVLALYAVDIQLFMKALTMALLRRFALAAATALLSTTASAAIVPFSGTLSNTDPLFQRPLVASGFGDEWYHDVFAFFVTAGGTYTLQTTSASLNGSAPDNTFIALYEDSFSPGFPLTNLFGANDNGFSSGFLSLITLALSADTQYFLVVTSFGTLRTGDYTGTISNDGDGTAVLGELPPPNVVPLPGTLALAGLGLAGLAAARRKRAG